MRVFLAGVLASSVVGIGIASPRGTTVGCADISRLRRAATFLISGEVTSWAVAVDLVFRPTLPVASLIGLPLVSRTGVGLETVPRTFLPVVGRCFVGDRFDACRIVVVLAAA